MPVARGACRGGDEQGVLVVAGNYAEQKVCATRVRKVNSDRHHLGVPVTAQPVCPLLCP